MRNGLAERLARLVLGVSPFPTMRARAFWYHDSPFWCQSAYPWSGMASNPSVNLRLRPIIHAYLDELAKHGAYGKGKQNVIRHFVENGIVAALQGGVLDKKDVRDHGETLEENENDES